MKLGYFKGCMHHGIVSLIEGLPDHTVHLAAEAHVGGCTRKNNYLPNLMSLKYGRNLFKERSRSA